MACECSSAIRLDRRRSRVPAVSPGGTASPWRYVTRLDAWSPRRDSRRGRPTLALAFAANLTIAALVYGVLLRPLPYRDANRLVEVGHRTPGLGVARAGQSQGAWFFYRRESRSFEAIGIYNENVVNLTDGGLEAERVPIAMISATSSTRSACGRCSAASPGKTTARRRRRR